MNWDWIDMLVGFGIGYIVGVATVIVGIFVGTMIHGQDRNGKGFPYEGKNR